MKNTIIAALLILSSSLAYGQSANIGIQEQTVIGNVSFDTNNDNVFIDAFDSKTLAASFPKRYLKNPKNILTSNADVDFEHLPKNEQDKLLNNCSDNEICEIRGIFHFEEGNYKLVRVKSVKVLISEPYGY